MSNDPLKNWKLEEGNEPLERWKLQDSEQSARHLQLQEGTESAAGWQPVEYTRAAARPGSRNWLLPSIVVVALLIALAYVGYVGFEGLGGLASNAVGPDATPAATEPAAATEPPASEEPTSEEPAAEAGGEVAEAPTATPEPPTATPLPTLTPQLVTVRVGTVNELSGVNARRAATTTAEIVRMLGNGEKVTVVRQEGEWLQVILSDNQSGWAWAEYIDQAVGDQMTLEAWNAVLAAAGLSPVTESVLVDEPAAPVDLALSLIVIADPGATVRVEPSTQAAVVGQVLLGAMLSASGRTEAADWLLVTLPEGSRGWIAADLVGGGEERMRLAVARSDLLVGEGSAPAAGVTAGEEPFVLQRNAAVPPAPYTNTLPAIGPAIAVSETVGVRTRTAPTLTADVSSILPDGAVLPVTGRTADGAWVQVTLPDNQRVWVFAEVVNLSSDIASAPLIGESAEQPAASGGAATLTVTSLLGANVRARPDNTSDALETVARNATFPALGRSADSTWIQIQLADGNSGWLLATAAQVSVAVETLDVKE
jgi:uncharacterized protein YgiM (DUF1202 family)